MPDQNSPLAEAALAMLKQLTPEDQFNTTFEVTNAYKKWAASDLDDATLGFDQKGLTTAADAIVAVLLEQLSDRRPRADPRQLARVLVCAGICVGVQVERDRQLDAEALNQEQNA